MFLKLIKMAGKPICAVLYAAFAALAAKKKPVPLIVLLLMHTTEYFTVGRKVAAEHKTYETASASIEHMTGKLVNES